MSNIARAGIFVDYYKYASDKSLVGPLSSLIIHVGNDDCVNLLVYSEDGTTNTVTSVPLISSGSARPNVNFCEWRPLQEKQAMEESYIRDVTEAAKRGRYS